MKDKRKKISFIRKLVNFYNLEQLPSKKVSKDTGRFVRDELIKEYGEEVVNLKNYRLTEKGRALAQKKINALDVFLDNPAKNKGTRWSEEEHLKLINDFGEGIPLDIIGYELGRHPTSLGLRLHKIEKERKSGPYTNKEKRILIQSWNDGDSVFKIGTKLNRKRNSILGSLSSLPGYPRKVPSKVLKMFPEKHEVLANLAASPKIDAEIESLAMDGYKMTHIAKQIGISLEDVEDTLEELGILDNYWNLMYTDAENLVDTRPNTKEISKSVKEYQISIEERERKKIRRVESLIKNKETQRIEHKATYQKCIRNKDYSRKVALMHEVFSVVNSFLNTIGGDLLIGVEDKTSKIIGIEFDDQFYKNDTQYSNSLYSAFKKHFNPSVEGLIKINITPHHVDNEIKKVCWIVVKESSTPIQLSFGEYLNDKKWPSDHQEFYIRKSDNSISLNMTERDQYIRDHPNFKK